MRTFSLFSRNFTQPLQRKAPWTVGESPGIDTAQTLHFLSTRAGEEDTALRLTVLLFFGAGSRIVSVRLEALDFLDGIFEKSSLKNVI